MNQYDRKKLYEEVWQEPVSAVAKRYGVSDTALAKACRRLNVPLPPRGYWAKLRSGQTVIHPELPDDVPDRPSAASLNQNNKAGITSAKPGKKVDKPAAKDKKAERSERLTQQIKAFMRCHMIEKEDLVHHFKFLISCLENEYFESYADSYKKKRVTFLEDCIKQIKAIHLPALLIPWTFYDCEESSSGFSITLCQLEKMSIENNEVDGEELIELCSVIDIPYNLVTISEYAKLLRVSEKTVEKWINTGKLSGALYEDGDWKIPEFHQIPEDEEYPVIMYFSDETHPDIPSYPLLSCCERLAIIPDGHKYCLKFRGKQNEWAGQLYISKKEKDALMGELLKQGFAYDYSAYEKPYYSIRKHFEVDFSHWYEIQSCNELICSRKTAGLLKRQR